jgi:hypothetical protein
MTSDNPDTPEEILAHLQVDSNYVFAMMLNSTIAKLEFEQVVALYGAEYLRHRLNMLPIERGPSLLQKIGLPVFVLALGFAFGFFL